MSHFFTSSEGILFMSTFVLVFIFGFFAYLIWKFYKLSSHRPVPGEKIW